MTVDLLWRPERGIEHLVSYSTHVLKTHDGTEQRIARRVKPVQAIRMTLDYDDATRIQGVRGDLLQRANDTWRIPRWWESYTATAAIPSSGTSITTTTTYCNLVAGDTVVLIDPLTEDSHIDTVDAVNVGSIDITTGTSQIFPVGSQLYKLESYRLDNPTGLARPAPGREGLSLSATLAAPTALIGTGGSVATYQASTDAAAKQVIAGAPLSSANGYSFEAGTERIDFASRFNQYTRWSESVELETRTYRINTTAELRWWEVFLTACVGRREAFYVPTFRDDLTLTSQPSSGASVITVNAGVGEVCDYETDWHGAGYANLRLSTGAGEVYREVDSITDNLDGTSDLTLDSALGAGAGSVISQISYLRHMRLAADEIKFDHDGIRSTVTLAMTTAIG